MLDFLRRKPALIPGTVWDGPRAICDDAIVGFVHAAYALTEDGKQLLFVNGRPVRLMQVDLAPDDPTDGSEEYVIAGPGDPAQKIAPVVRERVELEIETEGQAGVSA